jgi:hypothetical protein
VKVCVCWGGRGRGRGTQLLTPYIAIEIVSMISVFAFCMHTHTHTHFIVLMKVSKQEGPLLYQWRSHGFFCQFMLVGAWGRSIVLSNIPLLDHYLISQMSFTFCLTKSNHVDITGQESHSSRAFQLYQELSPSPPPLHPNFFQIFNFNFINKIIQYSITLDS